MDLKWVKTFVTVYEEGSFRAAANRLFISQPSITVHIKALEEALQVQLFKREHTRVKITEVGKHYYVMAKKLLEQVEEDSRVIQSLANTNKVRLTIALSAVLTSTNLLNIVHDFMVDYPNYEIEMMMLETNNMDELLNNERIHIAISLYKTKSTNLHSELILSEPTKIIYPSKAHIEGDTVDQQLKNLFASYPLYVGYLKEHAQIMEWLGKEYTITQLKHVKDALFAIKLINENMGVGLIPAFQVASEIAEGKLKVFDIGPIATVYKVNIYMNHLKEQERIQPFLRYVRNHFV